MTVQGDGGVGNTLRNQVAAAANGDTIEVDRSTVPAIGLLSTLTIDKNLTIDGAGVTIQRTGMGPFRVINVDVGVTCSMSDLTVNLGETNGSGGGIYNSGTLTLFGVTVYNCLAGNSGGGIFNAQDATLTMTNGDVVLNKADGQGGGIFNEGDMNISCSSIDINEAASGGGIYNSLLGTALLSDTDVYLNDVTTFGAGIYTRGYFEMSGGSIDNNESATSGGGIYVNGTNAGALFIGVEITSNDATAHGGGFYVANGTLLLDECTLSGNEAMGNADTDGGAVGPFGTFAFWGTLDDPWDYA